MHKERAIYIPMGKFNLPGNFRERCASLRVQQLSKQLLDPRIGLLERPKVRRGDGDLWNIVTGNDRIAAHHVAGLEGVNCWDVGDISDEQAELWELVSDAVRRHDPDEQHGKLSRIVEIEEHKILGETHTSDTPRRGRPISARTRAVKRVAEMLNVPESRVRKAEYLARRKAGKVAVRPGAKPGEQIQGPPKGWQARPFPSFGIELEPGYLYTIERVQNHIDDAASAMKRALIALSYAHKYGLPLDTYFALRETLTKVSADTRGMRPRALCAWCKGQDGLQQQCAACQGSGFNTDGQALSIPPELQDPEKLLVAKDGQYVSLDELFPVDALEGFE